MSASAHEFAEVGIGLAFDQQLGNALLEGRQLGGVRFAVRVCDETCYVIADPVREGDRDACFALMNSAGMYAEFRESLGAVLRMLGGAASYALGC